MCGLLHRVFAHQRQAPDEGIDGAAMDGLLDQLLGGEGSRGRWGLCHRDGRHGQQSDHE
jgi:hypothetical protein